MTYETTGYDENTPLDGEPLSTPPLCLIHYFGGSTPEPPEANRKPPGTRREGWIAERQGNLLILEFVPPPETTQAKWQKKRHDERLHSRITLPWILLMLSFSLLLCLATLRF